MWTCIIHLCDLLLGYFVDQLPFIARAFPVPILNPPPAPTLREIVNTTPLPSHLAHIVSDTSKKLSIGPLVNPNLNAGLGIGYNGLGTSPFGGANVVLLYRYCPQVPMQLPILTYRRLPLRTSPRTWITSFNIVALASAMRMECFLVFLM